MSLVGIPAEISAFTDCLAKSGSEQITKMSSEFISLSISLKGRAFPATSNEPQLF